MYGKQSLLQNTLKKKQQQYNGSLQLIVSGSPKLLQYCFVSRLQKYFEYKESSFSVEETMATFSQYLFLWSNLCAVELNSFSQAQILLEEWTMKEVSLSFSYFSHSIYSFNKHYSNPPCPSKSTASTSSCTV